MTRTTILAEFHAARRQILANYNGDTAAYLRDSQTKLEESGRPIEQREQRTMRSTLSTLQGNVSRIGIGEQAA